MRELPAKDASALALLAEHPRVSQGVFEPVLAMIRDPFAREVALAITGRAGADRQTSEAVARAVEELRKWVEENRRQDQLAALASGR